LAGEGSIYIPGFPGALAHDEIDWRTGELRLHLRAPKPVPREVRSTDPFELTHDRLLALYGYRSLIEGETADRADNADVDNRSPLDVMLDTENEVRRRG
jgi:hypothetical protein